MSEVQKKLAAAQRETAIADAVELLISDLVYRRDAVRKKAAGYLDEAAAAAEADAEAPAQGAPAIGFHYDARD